MPGISYVYTPYETWYTWKLDGTQLHLWFRENLCCMYRCSHIEHLPDSRTKTCNWKTYQLYMYLYRQSIPAHTLQYTYMIRRPMLSSWQWLHWNGCKLSFFLSSVDNSFLSLSWFSRIFVRAFFILPDFPGYFSKYLCTREYYKQQFAIILGLLKFTNCDRTPPYLDTKFTKRETLKKKCIYLLEELSLTSILVLRIM